MVCTSRVKSTRGCLLSRLTSSATQWKKKNGHSSEGRGCGGEHGGFVRGKSGFVGNVKIFEITSAGKPGLGRIWSWFSLGRFQAININIYIFFKIPDVLNCFFFFFVVCFLDIAKRLKENPGVTGSPIIENANSARSDEPDYTVEKQNVTHPSVPVSSTPDDFYDKNTVTLWW